MEGARIREKPFSAVVDLLSAIHAPLHGYRLLLAQSLWAVVLTLVSGLFVLAVPARFTQLLSDLVGYSSALEGLGISNFFLALYVLVPEVVSTLLLVIAGVLIFRLKSDDWMVMFYSVMLILLGAILPATLYVLGTRSMLLLRTILAIQGMAIWMSMLFFLLFPDGRFVPCAARWGALASGLWFLSWPLFPGALLENVATVNFVIIFLAYPLAFSAQLYRQVRFFDAERRRKLRLVVLGLGGALTFWLGIQVADSVAGSLLPSSTLRFYQIFIAPALNFFPALLIFLSIIVSLLRYRLWDVDLLISQSLVYSLLTALLGGLYFVIVFVLTLLIRMIVDEANSTVVVFVATLSIALAFNPLRQRIQAVIDRALYRTRVDYQAVVQEASARLAGSIDLDQLAHLLADEVPEQLQIAWGRLVVASPDNSCLESMEEPPVCQLRPEHPLVNYLVTAREPLAYYKTPPDLPVVAREFLGALQAGLCVPLLAGEQLVGLYLLGNKLSGSVYSVQEIHLLHLLGQQAAISVENARLYRQVQRYSLHLEEQVEERTRQLALAYRELEAQHAQLDVILRNVADALVVTDEEGYVILTNPAFEAMLSEPTERIVGQVLDDVLPQVELCDAIEAARRSAPLVVTVDVVWEGRTYLASACALVGARAVTGGVVTVLRDITREVEVARMKDDFVSMVSHELRTPMTSVLGFSKLIRKQFSRHIEPRLSEERPAQRAAQRIQDNLEIIIAEGDRLTRLINDVLDVTKLDAGRTQWELDAVALPDVIQNSVMATQSLARQKALRVSCEMSEELPVLYGDQDRLVQVVTNLLSNAIKFTDQGEVQVQAWLLEPGDDIAPLAPRYPEDAGSLPAPYPQVAVSVTDTGVGITRSDLPRVFERFVQVGNKQDGSRRPGTGLGLAISRQIVQHHGGHIWVESLPGEGSRFIFTLPVEADRVRQAAFEES